MADDHIEKFAFKAEINQLLGLIINTTDYIDREIFLRELISNSSDALDIVKYEALSDKSSDEELDILFIRLVPDQHEKTISIIDNGVGMTRVDLVNLGTIARSGMKEFVDALQAGNDVTKELCTGFYSCYLVAKKVTVTTKNDYDDQYTWESEAKGSFSLTRDANGELGRGTKVTLFLTKDQWEYLDKSRIKDLVKKRSDFITYPIYLWTKKTTEEQINGDGDDDPEDEEEDEDEEWDVPLKCNLCGRTYVTDDAMRDHQSMHHRHARVVCVVRPPKCGRRFFSKAKMALHCHRRHPKHPNVR